MGDKRKIQFTDEYISELKDLGKAIRYARKKSGLSLRGLSEECGVMFYQLSLIENGKCGTSTHTLHRIVNALNTTVREAYENLEMEEA